MFPLKISLPLNLVFLSRQISFWQPITYETPQKNQFLDLASNHRLLSSIRGSGGKILEMVRSNGGSLLYSVDEQLAKEDFYLGRFYTFYGTVCSSQGTQKYGNTLARCLLRGTQKYILARTCVALLCLPSRYQKYMVRLQQLSLSLVESVSWKSHDD